jgi:hypothetical protein
VEHVETDTDNERRELVAVRDTVIGAGSRLDNLVRIGHNVILGRCCVKRCLVAPRRWWSTGVISQGRASPRFARRCAYNLVRKTPGPADKAWVKNPGQHAGIMAVRLPDWMAWCWCTAGELVRSHWGWPGPRGSDENVDARVSFIPDGGAHRIWK